MKTADLKKQLVDLLIDTHVTFGTHEIAEYLIKHGVTIQPMAEWTLNLDGSGTCGHCHFTQRGVYDQDSYQRYCGCCGAKMKLKGE